MRFKGEYTFTDEELLEMVAKFLKVDREHLKDPEFFIAENTFGDKVTALRVSVETDGAGLDSVS